MKSQVGFLLIALCVSFVLAHAVAGKTSMIRGNSADREEAMVKKSGNDTLLCEGCELLVGLLETELTTNSTEEDVFKLIDKICPYIPKQYVDVCPYMVEQMGPIVLYALVHRMNPTTVCEIMRACPAPPSKIVAPQPGLKYSARRRSPTTQLRIGN
eukprot:EC850196.1.p1 GENE.EC850196.1~~EC850196.1.p1  ORF type:complete len:156 (+),score=52.41 EC850196.1:55-522(+)